MNNLNFKKLFSTFILFIVVYLSYGQVEIIESHQERTEYANTSYFIYNHASLTLKNDFSVNAATDGDFTISTHSLTSVPEPDGLAQAGDNIYITFSDVMDYSIVESIIFISGSESGNISGVWSQDGKTLIFDPTIDFVEGEIITVHWTDSIILLEEFIGLNGLWDPLTIYHWEFVVHGGWTYVPDLAFETAIEEIIGEDGVPGAIQNHLAEEVTFLDVSNRGIVDMQGLEAFTALTYLNCSANQLTQLDVSYNQNFNDFELVSDQNVDLVCLGVNATQEAGLRTQTRLSPFDSWTLSSSIYSQECGSQLILTCRTTMPNETVLFAFWGGNGHAQNIDWGDNSYIRSNISGYVFNAYEEAGDHKIALRWDNDDYVVLDLPNYTKLISIDQWGDQIFTDVERAFSGCSNLVAVPKEAPLLTDGRTMNYMFLDAISFNSDISNWDVSKVEGMTRMFDGAKVFNQDISNWDVSKVDGMSGMFNGAESFNQDISNWDVGKVVNMSNMFDGAKAFNQDLSSWETTNVFNMERMFFGAESFNQDISNWEVNDVTNMSSMFFGAESFNQDISNWEVSQVTNMSYMFFGAESFNQDLSSWISSNVSNLRSFLDYSGMSETNYSNYLIGWSVLDEVPSGLILGAEGLTYCGQESIDAWNLLDQTYNWDIRDDGPCGSSGRLRLEEEIEEELLSSEIQLYPNPSTGKFVLKLERYESAKVSVFDVLGNLLKTKTLTSNVTEIDLSEMSSQLVLVRVLQAGETQTFKLMIEN